MRVEWDLQRFSLQSDNIGKEFEVGVASRFGMRWQLHFSSDKPRMALFVSKLPHCFYDVLSRYEAGEWQIDIPVIISNHNDMAPVAERFGIDYLCLPVDKNNKPDQEAKQLELLDNYKIDFIVLARYMQILSEKFIAHYPQSIINIHHSFLPAFPGRRPYHSAYERGVKIIGASSHYVTADLDAGPIIEQDVERVNHSLNPAQLTMIGQDIERRVLARAVRYHAEDRVILIGSKTVVFS